MTENEIKFLLNQWGQSFITDVLKDITANITKSPNDSVVLAVAIKHVNKRIDDVITTIRTLQATQANSGFDAVVSTSPQTPDPIPAPAPILAPPAT